MNSNGSQYPQLRGGHPIHVPTNRTSLFDAISNGTLMNSTTTSPPLPTTAYDRNDQLEYWGINAFILFLFACVYVVCCKCRGNSSSASSPPRVPQEQQRSDRPGRKHELQQWFETSATKKIVTEMDFILHDASERMEVSAVMTSSITASIKEDYTVFIESQEKQCQRIIEQSSSADLPSGDTSSNDNYGTDEIDVGLNKITSSAATANVFSDNLQRKSLDMTSSVTPVLLSDTVETENDETETITSDTHILTNGTTDTTEDFYESGRVRLSADRSVSNGCAICLSPYQAGETIVWSCNPDCKHAFHEGCIVDWFVKLNDQTTLCPCCRQTFTNWEQV